jgi:hypothetical protein
MLLAKNTVEMIFYYGMVMFSGPWSSLDVRIKLR